MMNYVRAERILMKSHPEMSEKWIQAKIAEDPSIPGLGDLVLRAQERIHPKAGRLDLLLQDPDNARRYEVELQLGATDESHIIRTIEYWDIERKRYQQYAIALSSSPRTSPVVSSTLYPCSTAPSRLSRSRCRRCGSEAR
ncbi:hypothetical protein [Rhizobium ruizarguesonis]|uniref:hypothetical protein n=1 Tax=Rhizobium ruizarguesonis TaxID=2081791 RepID=UPI0018D5169D|nr:hypothetical protein [Rhizobium ruizarguesonis]